ncbi:MAG: M23 family peptidase, partial [Cytophagales bacterium]|nr:M23 family peptidase [Cytophagales bacterium]
DIIPSGTDYDYYSDLIDIKFKNGNIYDTLYLTTSHEISEKGRERFTIATLTTPLHNTISITLKPTLSYPKTEKTFAYHIEGNRFEFVGGEWTNGRIQFNTKELGQFTVLADSTPPSIGRIYCNPRTARFRIYDNLSGIAKFEANINGEWLLMKYDYKTGIVQSERLDSKKLLKGDFQLKVTDRAGNERIHTQKILEQKR